MKNVGNILLFLLMMVAGNSFAGVKVIGNGGDAVVCYVDATRSVIKSVQMFDYWEQEQVLKFGAITLGDKNLAIQDKITIATNRIGKFDPKLAEQIKNLALNLDNNIQKYLVTNYIIPEIDDANPKVIPTQPDCYIEQFAIQYKDVTTGQKRFVISEKFYNHSSVSNDDRAGLLMHEALYRYSILKNSNLNNSDGVRYFNYIISSDRIDRMSLYEIDKYVDFLKIAGLENFECQPHQKYASATSVLFLAHESGSTGSSCYNQIIKIDNFIELEIPSGYNVWFSGNPDDNTIKGLSIHSNSKGMLRINFKNNIYSAGDLTVSWKNGKAHKVQFDTDKPLDINNNLFFKGPLDTLLTCKNISYSLIDDEIVYCGNPSDLVYGSQMIKFRSISKFGNNYEISNLKPTEFVVLGSKNLLKFSPTEMCNNGYCRSVIDKNLFLISGGNDYFYQLIKPSIVFNGFKYAVNKVEVSSKDGKYFLTASTDSQEFSQPKIKGLRLVNTGHRKPEKSPDGISSTVYYNSAKYFCERNGYFSEGNYVIGAEYISAESEQFFDIFTGQIVYKTDETVEVIQSVNCKSTQITTDVY